jgi:hypothetical protein
VTDFGLLRQRRTGLPVHLEAHEKAWKRLLFSASSAHSAVNSDYRLNAYPLSAGLHRPPAIHRANTTLGDMVRITGHPMRNRRAIERCYERAAHASTGKRCCVTRVQPQSSSQWFAQTYRKESRSGLRCRQGKTESGRNTHTSSLTPSLHPFIDPFMLHLHYEPFTQSVPLRVMLCSVQTFFTNSPF